MIGLADLRITAAIAWFELRQRLRRLSTWVYFVVFFAIAVLCVLAAGGALSGATVNFGGGSKVFINSPFSIHMLETLIGLFGTVIVASIAGQATYQDIDHRMTPLFFTAPIREGHYLAGRFIGAFLACTFVYAAIGLGVAITMQLPIHDAARMGPSPGAIAYLQPYFVGLLPDLFITVSIFFAVAALTRRMLPVHAGSVVLMLGYMIALNLSDDVENKTLTSILDPFGFIATDRMSEYWTVAERNTRLVPLSGILLYNRLLWSGLAAILVAITFVRFSFTTRRDAKNRRAEPIGVQDVLVPTTSDLMQKKESGIGIGAPAKVITLDFSPRASIGLLWKLTRLQWRETVKNVIFLVLVLAGLLFMGSTAQAVGRMFGTVTWPVTYQVLEMVGGSFQIFIIAIVTFYSGELVWRERDAKLSQIFDALPTSRWLIFASKWIALVLVQVLLLAIVLVSGVLLQTLKGYHHYELGLYVRWLFAIRLVDLAFLTTVAMLVHVVINHKYTGHFVMVGYYALAILLPQLGLQHKMYRLGSQPSWTYSDMNGFGPFVEPLVWFKLYWGSLAIVMAIVTNLFWQRGVETGLRHRLKLARQRLSRISVLAGLFGLIAFASTGAYLFYNIDIRNRYRTTFEQEELSAKYERQYKRDWDGKPQPRIIAATVHADLFPEERRASFTGDLEIENKSSAPIDSIFVNLPERAKVNTLTFGALRGEKLVSSDAIGTRIYSLTQPLGVHEHATIHFDIAYDNRGFSNEAGDLHIVENGTFFNNAHYLPSLGYSADGELSDDKIRRKHGLAEKPRMRDLDDPKGLANNYISSDADWIKLDTTITTSPDQIAIAPGYLKREWISPENGGRRSFHYVMDKEILNFYSFISARYAVKRDTWKPSDKNDNVGEKSVDVTLEVFYHPTHDYDVDRMIRAMKASLDYFTREFGPYQHHQARIIEFPRYEHFAQSFPNTIPYSEAIGFIARVDDSKEDEIDYPFYITAHEIAHQWWAHQVIGGAVQGSTMLSESFAQYSAFMVMKHTYGERAMRKFLRYELDRYLRGRGTESKKEVPLMRVENQPYIHYAKGSLVMYALQDAVGEDVVNRALRMYLEQAKYKGPPYTSTREFMDVLHREAPMSARPLIHDLFEAITLYELRALSATAKKLGADGNANGNANRYEVTIKASAKKVYANDLGVETETPMDEEIAFGALDDKGNAIHVEKHRVTTTSDATTTTDVTFVIDQKPAKAGIDPLNGRIDRKPEDNVVSVEILP